MKLTIPFCLRVLVCMVTWYYIYTNQTTRCSVWREKKYIHLFVPSTDVTRFHYNTIAYKMQSKELLIKFIVLTDIQKDNVYD